MKQFRFTLSAVRELRQAEEQDAQKVFAAAVRACEETAARLAMLENDLQNAWQLLRGGFLQATRADQMARARSWCSVLDERREQLAGELKKCQDHVDAMHKLLQIAAMRREALDRLLKKQRHAHDREAQSEEQKFLDEIATRGAWRGNTQLEAA
ncbi:MAG TPA: flagellar export protein FliJ [Candidatus Limnocylindria bacterium]|nr:flagellar export protein FliJ [Candidatus Limnocylindria bacterium]